MSLSNLLFSTEGRIRRKTYWLYSFALYVIVFVLMVLDGAFGTLDGDTGYGLLSGIFTLIMAIPTYIVAIKRSHDREHSGWFLLILFIPILNLWPLIELSFFAGTDGDNQYGEDPRQLIA